MSGSVAPLWLRSAPMSVAQVTTEGSPDTRGLGQHLKPCWCQRIVLSLGPCGSERPKLPPRAIVTSTPKLLLLAVSGSVLMAVVRVTTGTMSCTRALLSWSRPSLTQGELTLSLSVPGIMCLHTGKRAPPLTTGVEELLLSLA